MARAAASPATDAAPDGVTSVRSRPRRSSHPDALDTYRSKRHFDRTPEPAGAGAGEAERRVDHRFVVQRHRASRLHYDFRLELGDRLVSWSVPKGPTLDPVPKRLAVHVEDHPIEYLDFEGVIPKGEYGGGDVIVWDRGTWIPASDDPERDLRDGELHFDLEGQKLAGRFVLRRRSRDDDKTWLLIHKRDEHAVEGWTAETDRRSVKSGKTNEEVAAAPAARWRSGAPAATAEEAIPAEGERFEWSPAVTDDELAALDDLGPGGVWHLQGREIKVTNLDKELFPPRDDAPATSKRDLLHYLGAYGHRMVPFLRGRAVNNRRHPDGAGTKGFWQKELPSHAPAWIERWQNPDADPGETQIYAVVEDVPTLVWLGQQGVLEWHPWTSRTVSPSRPSWALIDIDPGDATARDDVVLLARVFRTALEHLGVVGALKTTGQSGLQIWVPIEEIYTFGETRRWVETLSRSVGAVLPELVSWRWRTDERGGLARLDYTQNAVNKTLVAPYSTRARPGAPISVPIEWDALDDMEAAGWGADRWTIRDAPSLWPDRTSTELDALQRVWGLPQKLPSLG